jgi:rubrerythrin
MSKTYDNLMEAFAGESQANHKYLAFAAQAEKEGCKQAAKMFRAAAEAETIHALAHLRNAKEVKTTAENLQAAIAGETHECVNMYPAMILDAKNEEEMAIAKYMDMVCKVEGVHAELYKDVANDPVTEVTDYYICPVCGFISKGAYEGKCPVCGAAGEKFFTVK